MPKSAIRSVNYGSVAAVLASVVAWLGLYALYADFASDGVELMQHAGVLGWIEGAALLAFSGVGTLVALALVAGLIALAVKVGSGAVEPVRAAETDVARRAIAGRARPAP